MLLLLPCSRSVGTSFCHSSAQIRSSATLAWEGYEEMQPNSSAPTPSPRSSRQTTTNTKQGLWRCSYCPKVFAQREYRQKHQQRCLQSSRRQKLSKQKSCTACAVSKLSCDQGTPACSRCVNRNKECQYVSASSVNALATAESQSLPALQRHRLSAPTVDSTNLNTSSSRFGGIIPSPGQLARNRSSFLSPANEAEPGSRWEQQEIPWFSQDLFTSSELAISPDLVDNSHEIGLSGGSEGFNFDLLGSLGILTQNHILPGQTFEVGGQSRVPSSTLSSGERFPEAVPTVDLVEGQKEQPGAKGTDERHETLHDTVRAVREEALSNPITTGLPYKGDPKAQASAYDILGKNDDFIRVIRNYPGVMLRPGEYPPFVHHKLYRCSTGDVAEPLAKAFCCIGAFYASVPTSEPFICAIMDEESNKLVKEFHQLPNSVVDMLSVVHAMSIYQILGFFDGINSEQARAAESKQMFFLKMTRRLVKLSVQASTAEDEDKNWQQWLVNESIRRTVFLVNAINTLSCRMQKQDPNYFEPLDDDLIYSMTLPAPDAIWKASSVEEWIFAKALFASNHPGRTKTTISQAVDRLREQPVSVSANADQLWFDQADDFTRLVIATANVS